MSLFPDLDAEERVRAPINGDILRWAREIGGFSRDELATAVGRTGDHDLIGQWEREDAFPTARQLEKLANKLKRSVAVFFLPSRPSEPDPTTIFQRTISLQSHGFSSELRLAIRTARYVRDRFVDLLDATEQAVQCKVPQATTESDPSEIAKLTREAIHIGVSDQCGWPNNHAYDLWMEALMGCGVLPQQFSAPIGEGWGFSITDGDLPVIAVNRKVYHRNAKIFTLWHEVAHVTLRDSSVSVIEFGNNYGNDQEDAVRTEKWCNRFAASFLLPLDDPVVVEALESVRDEEDFDASRIHRIATKFRVSKYVFLGRLREAGYIPQDRFTQLRHEWWAIDSAREQDRLKKIKAKESSGGPPPWKVSMADRGRPLAKHVFFALRRGAISESDAADILGIGANSFDKAEHALLARENEE